MSTPSTEIIQAKAQLEQSILSAIAEFEEHTGFNVTKVGLSAGTIRTGQTEHYYIMQRRTNFVDTVIEFAEYKERKVEF